jgi:tetratricopeptide (TPR) repeat protein
VLLAFRKADPTGAGGALIEALRDTYGPEAIVREEATPDAQDAACAPQGSALPLRDANVLSALPPEVRKVLRVGAVMGSGFEAELMAELLGVDTLVVVDALQRAVDAGVPVEDRGEGRFYLPQPLLEALRSSTLPSLSRLVHGKLAALLSGVVPGAPEEVEAPPPPEAPSPSHAETAKGQAADERQEKVGPRSHPWPYGEIFAAAESAAAAKTSPEAPQMRPERVDPSSGPAAKPSAVVLGFTRPNDVAPSASRVANPSLSPRGDDARAAGHLAAAGESEAGAERYLAATRQAAAVGAWAQALAHGRKALSLLERLPESRKRRLLRIAVLLEFGRLEWQASLPDPSFTLAGALEVLERAQASLEQGDPLELFTTASLLVAGVCYDIGDQRSLERALDELTRASRLLQSAGDATGAARLLNDQAAVYIRLGDPVRATYLLGESRKVFEARSDNDPMAMIEMAETDHLFARIPLHVKARPGREDDALSMGLDHAIAAERTYRRLGDSREIARVWETMGRLELRKARIDRAMAHLLAAADLEGQTGDLIGLARSTAALSEVLAVSGRDKEALAMLGDSVAFNLEKGSPIGLAFNRRAFDTLARTATAAEDTGTVLREVSERLCAAEAVLGRISLPGERDQDQPPSFQRPNDRPTDRTSNGHGGLTAG